MPRFRDSPYLIESTVKEVDALEVYLLTYLTGPRKSGPTPKKPLTTLYKYLPIRYVCQVGKEVLARGVWASSTQNWWSMVGGSWLLSTRPCFTSNQADVGGTQQALPMMGWASLYFCLLLLIHGTEALAYFSGPESSYPQILRHEHGAMTT